jgi:hypothetical protein
MILSASRRTDIPCYYGEWLANRLEAGYALARNPFNNAQVSRVALSPENIDCIVFWTKDAKNIMPRLRAVEKMGYHYYFQWTITPYGRDIEPNMRGKREIEDSFVELSSMIGKDRVVWRYDPIVINGAATVGWHKSQFARMCEKLSPHAGGVVISFVDVYAKLKTPLVRSIRDDEIAELSEFIGKAAAACGLETTACCEKMDLARYGIGRASCVDKAIVERLRGGKLAPGAGKDKNQREGCGCAQSVDIGAYNTCLNGCVYCYANDGAASAKRRHGAHDPKGELLTGAVRDGEKVYERR